MRNKPGSSNGRTPDRGSGNGSPNLPSGKSKGNGAKNSLTMQYLPLGIATWDVDVKGIPTESMSVFMAEEELNGIRFCEMFLFSLKNFLLVDAAGNLINNIYPYLRANIIKPEDIVDINLFDGGHFWDRYNIYVERVKFLKLNGGKEVIFVNGLQQFFNYFAEKENKEMIDFTDKTIVGVIYKNPFAQIEQKFADNIDLYARRIMKIESFDNTSQIATMTILKDEDGFVEKKFTFYVDKDKMWRH